MPPGFYDTGADRVQNTHNKRLLYPKTLILSSRFFAGELLAANFRGEIFACYRISSIRSAKLPHQYPETKFEKAVSE